MSVGMSMPSPRNEGRLGMLDPRRTVMAVSFLLARLKPDTLGKVLKAFSRGAKPARFDSTTNIHNMVVATSPHCAGWRGCLPRSIAVALLCRCKGAWPTWCVGVRRTPPFAAHAWVESENQVVGEAVPASTYSPLMRVVSPRGSRT